MTTQGDLTTISERIRADFVAKTAARDAAVTISRELIRYCSMAIRASHRDEWEEAERLVAEAVRVAVQMATKVKPYPELYFTGYTQDAMKELCEAKITLAIAQGKPFPAPEEIGAEYAAYLNGLAEAAGEALHEGRLAGAEVAVQRQRGVGRQHRRQPAGEGLGLGGRGGGHAGPELGEDRHGRSALARRCS